MIKYFCNFIGKIIIALGEKMKKKIAIIVFVVLVVSMFCLLVSCKNNSSTTTTATEEEKQMIEKSFDTLKTGWAKTLAERAEKNNDENLRGNYTIDIKNTRLIKIKENTIEHFQNVAYIVEFLPYINYFDPNDIYTVYTGINDNVVIFKDGHQELGRRYINMYMESRYYFKTDEYVEEVKDFGSAFNRQITIKIK